MQIDPNVLGERETYKLLIGCVVPRPIAWVSTRDVDGVYNLAPFSFFNVIGSRPPALSIAVSYSDSPDQRKDTLRNIETTKEFVISIVSEDLAEAMNMTAINYPPEVDEFVVAGLTAIPGVQVRAPRVAESPVSFECRLHTMVPVGTGPGSATLVIGTIELIHLRDEIVGERNRIDIQKLRPIARLAGASYAYVHETFELARGYYDPQTQQVEQRPAS